MTSRVRGTNSPTLERILAGQGAVLRRHRVRGHSKIDSFGLWYKSVNFGAEACGRGSGSWQAAPPRARVSTPPLSAIAPRSNRFLKSLHSPWSSPEPGDLQCKPGVSKTTICSASAILHSSLICYRPGPPALREGPTRLFL